MYHFYTNAGYQKGDADLPYLLQECRHGDLLRLHVQHPWMFQHAPRSSPTLRVFLQTTFDEIFEVVTPFDPVLGFVFQFGNGLPDDVCQEIDQASPRLHFSSVSWEGKAVLGHFE